MRLTDLHPQWWHMHGDPAWVHRGLTFDCPVHGPTERLSTRFSNPIGTSEPAPGYKHYWLRQGNDFDTLTLTPSLDYTKYDNGELRDPTCWHGWIQAGNVT